MNPRVLYRAATYATDARSTADSVISALTPAAWYRNATGVTSAGGFASQWDDYSGNGRHLIQATGTNQPAYAAGVFTFDGADNFMARATWTQIQPVSVYVIGKLITWTANDTVFDGSSASSMILYQVTATPNIALYAGTVAANNTDLPLNTRGVIAAVVNGASSSIRINNSAKTTGNAGAQNPGGLHLGARGGGGSGFAHMAVEEVVLFGAAHDDATQSSVITALNNALTVF